MPSCPRLDPTNGARPCLTRMCIRSSSALAMHIHRWIWRYCSRVTVPLRVVVAIRSQSRQSIEGSRQRDHARSVLVVLVERPRDINHLIGCQAQTIQMLVVPAMEVGEVSTFRTLLPDALDLGQHRGHKLRLGRDRRTPQGVLDRERAGMLAVDIRDLGAKLGWWQELIDGGMDEHAGSVASRLMTENVQADARF